MNNSGSLCPAVKAAELIGDKWVLLILREMLLGTTRYNDFQRGIPRISPTVLSKRLKELEANGMVIKKTSAGGKSTEYRLTASGREIWPIVDNLAKWGLRWARRQIEDEDIDVAGFMWDFHRTFASDELPDGDTVICLQFNDVTDWKKWWLIANRESVDLCDEDTGHDVDMYVTCDFPRLVEVWMGDIGLKEAIAKDDILVTGETNITKSAGRWFPRSAYADVRPEKMLTS